MKRTAITLAAAALVAACATGPEYVRPKVEVPAAYKEASGWRPAQPRELEPRGAWWKIYNDALLDRMEVEVGLSNQNLAKFEAQYREALALVRSARSHYFPVVTGGVSVSRARSSSSGVGQVPLQPRAITTHNLPLQASWAPDIWDNIGRSVTAAEAGAQASAADIAAAKLSAQASLAQSYFQLRALDVQQRLLDDTVSAYKRSLIILQNQYAAGIVAKADVVQQQTQLATTQAQAIAIGAQRAQYEHAIALLVGRPASSFSIPRGALPTRVPTIPIGVPSELLERRPDIAAAERRMAQANAQIGVAESAFYPSLTLSAGAGLQSTDMARWLSAPSRYWSLGAAVADTLFDGGLRRAQTEQAVAAYDAEVAAYRQTVLTAFQQVEDNLATLSVLAREASAQREAVRLAGESLTLATNQYKAGKVDFLNVAAAQEALLANRRTAVAILGQRLSASAQLITNLGGGWNGAPTAPTVNKDSNHAK